MWYLPCHSCGWVLIQQAIEHVIELFAGAWELRWVLGKDILDLCTKEIEQRWLGFHGGARCDRRTSDRQCAE